MTHASLVHNVETHLVARDRYLSKIKIISARLAWQECVNDVIDQSEQLHVLQFVMKITTNNVSIVSSAM